MHTTASVHYTLIWLDQRISPNLQTIQTIKVSTKMAIYHNLDAVQQPWNRCARCTVHVAKLVTQITYKETNSYCILCLSPFYNYLQAMIGNRKAKEKWEANVPLCWVPPSPKSPLYVDSDIMYTCSVTAGLCVTAGSAQGCISKHLPQFRTQ